MRNRIDIDKLYMDKILENNETNISNYVDMMKKIANSTAIYKGEPIPFLYMPKIYTEKDLKEFNNLSAMLMRILRKVIDRYLTNKDFRKEFRFGELLESLILTEHGYNAYVPMARVDLFYRSPGEFKFCELNADGSSAMNEDREIGRVFRENNVFSNYPENMEFENFELFDSWVDECVSMYQEFGGSKINGTTVAITDWAGGGTVNEFEVFRDAFIRKGFNAFIADPRDMKYKDGKLFYKDIKVDIVYRRLVTREIIDRSGEIQDFIEACLNSDVCLIGPIKSQIIHNKRIFKILHDESTAEYLNSEEIDFIKKHIPMTRYFEGDSWDYRELIKDKDNLILKPTDLYASRGVYAGKDYSDVEWMKKLEECIDKDYLIQEYYSPHQTELLELVQGKFIKAVFNNITGIYMYNEKMAGMYSRVGKNPIISGLHDCYTLPTFIVKEE